MLLKHTGYLDEGDTQHFLGRNLTNYGQSIGVDLDTTYIEDLLQEVNMNNCKPAPTPGTNANKATLEDVETLSADQHRTYRRIVGKLQWLAFTRPDIAFATKDLARSLHQPTQADPKKAKHALKYLRGTTDYEFHIKPTAQLTSGQKLLDLEVYVDADWAGCPLTRKSTSGFIIYLLGALIQFGSRTQATVAQSSAESELYAICTGVNESLHIKEFLIESGLVTKLHIEVHTDSTAGKSIATRQGTSKKAKHIQIKFLYPQQQLVKEGIIRNQHTRSAHTTQYIRHTVTKLVARETLQRLIEHAGLRPRTRAMD